MKSVQTEMFVYSFDATTFRLVPYFQEQGLLGLKLRPLAAFPMMLKTQQTLCRLLEYNPCRVHIYFQCFWGSRSLVQVEEEQRTRGTLRKFMVSA